MNDEADAASWRIVPSSMLKAISYDEASGRLRVRFASGGTYTYHAVPAAVVAELLDPPQGSIGRYFGERIRDVYDVDPE